MTDPTAAQLLRTWIARQASADAIEWLDRAIEAAPLSDRALGLAYGTAPRRLGKAALVLSDADRAAANRARRGWTPALWRIDQAARVLLLLAISSERDFAAKARKLLATADVAETIAAYLGLSLYPPSPDIVALATDGLRTSIRDVFEAIVHANPFPAAAFDEAAWNQMVLKAVFIESSLDPIQGLDARRNPKLADMLLAYADERRAAHRSVPPELWRCIAPFGTAASQEILAEVSGTTAEETHER